jgi:hypothetical protein
LQILPVSAVSSFDCWLLSQESPYISLEGEMQYNAYIFSQTMLFSRLDLAAEGST